MADLAARKAAALERLASIPRILTTREKERERRLNHSTTAKQNEEARVVVMEEAVKRLEALL